jgi:hypothetical protein
MPDRGPDRIRRIRRAVATAAAVVFLGVWAAVGALGKGAASTSSSATAGTSAASQADGSSQSGTSSQADGSSQSGATSQADALPDVVTSQS